MNAPTPLIDIRPDHWEIVQSILHKHVPQYEVWAFGSRATWKAKAFSDLDLAIITDQPLSLDVSASLNDDFSESDLPWKVDVVDWATTSASFRKIMERDKVVVQEGEKSLGMAGEWKLTTLGEFVRLQRGYDLTAEERIPGNFPVMGSAGQNGTHEKFISQGPGVVIGRSGASMGRVHYVKSDYWPHNTCLYVTDFLGNDPRFTFYFLGALDLASYNSGSAQPSLNRNFVYTKSITIPLPKEQRAIAHILGTLDDKIELNRQQNETLEAMARALFKAWFVDFEPVRAKLEGRWQRGLSLPGLPAHLYDLFPDRLVESELGEIPEGWRMGSLGEVAAHPRRSVQPGEIKSETAYIALEHMPKRCIALSDWGVADGLESNKYEFKRGEILFGKLRPYFHKVGVAPIDGVCSTDIVVISPKQPMWFGFVLAHISSDVFVEYTNAGSTGTKMPRTSWAEMARYTVVLPHKDVAAAFNQHVQATSGEIIENIHESKSLVQLRNTLLPKLISGELRIPDAETFLKERGL